MREIKFRAWNKEKSVMVYDNEDDSEELWDGVCSSTVSLINTYLSNCFLSEEYTWMQFTGLKDKNGKDIYEGDIIATGTTRKHSREVVEYGHYSLTRFTGERGEYNEYIDIFGFYVPYDFLYEEMINGNVLVIGNMYEHPHLLTYSQEDYNFAEDAE